MLLLRLISKHLMLKIRINKNFYKKRSKMIYFFLFFSYGAQGGTWTRTSVKTEDFESSVSTIPPPGQIYVIFEKNFRVPHSLLFCFAVAKENFARGYGYNMSFASQTRIFAHLPFHHLGKFNFSQIL